MLLKIKNKKNHSIMQVTATIFLAAIVIGSTFAVAMTNNGRDNNPPYEPSDPIPENLATNVSIYTDISWTGEDPDGDPVTYDVYFGTTNPPPLLQANHTNTTYDLDILSPLTLYYWYIIAWDNQSASTTGKTWEFTTENYTNHPPNKPVLYDPANGSTNVSVYANLNWYGGDPDENDTATYNVYFGTNTTPPLVSNNQTGLVYDPNILEYNTTYYWKIIAWDTHGASTESDLAMFTTEIEPPLSVEITKPAEGAIYFRNNVVLSGLQRTIVVGSVIITAEVSGDAEVTKVEFYIDDDEQPYFVDTEAPYETEWGPLLSKRYIIKVIAYAEGNLTAQDQVQVFKWRLHPVLILAGAIILLKAATGMVTGWTIIRGYVFNMHTEGKDLVFRAIRLHYTRLTILGREKGVIKLEKCRLRDPNIKFQFNLGPLGKIQYISGVARGGFKEPAVGFDPFKFLNRFLPLLTE